MLTHANLVLGKLQRVLGGDQISIFGGNRSPRYTTLSVRSHEAGTFPLKMAISRHIVLDFNHVPLLWHLARRFKTCGNLSSNNILENVCFLSFKSFFDRFLIIKDIIL